MRIGHPLSPRARERYRTVPLPKGDLLRTFLYSALLAAALIGLAVLLGGCSAAANEIDSPKPKPKPEQTQARFTRGEILRMTAHAVAAGADAATTIVDARHGCLEGDPLIRPIIGLHASAPRVVALSAAEVLVVSYLAHRYPSGRTGRVLRIAQLALTGAHTEGAINNALLAHRGYK